MNNYKAHQKLLNDVKIILQRKYPNARFFDRHVGMFYTITGKIIKINKKGMADMWCIYNGKHYEFEIKTGKARQTKPQKAWEKTITDCGGSYFILRSSDEAQAIEL